ncbi:MAG TPA: serine hydrolase domain-containing protein [Symbiobacteriaceae bacterium]|nr:serine hydrolase domain-containing protein [Symbiobacteriaceae bacterium]
MQSARFAALGEYVRRQLEVTGIPGVGLGVAREGRLLHGEGYGLRDVGQGLAPDLDTLFFMGAAAKSFTCVAMLRLQEEGRLQVHDPVVRYLPGFRMPDAAATAQVTLHHLMTHTSGIPRLALPPGAADYGAFVDALSGQEYRPSGAPGEQFDYTDEGYALLGAVIEQVSGMPYQEYMARAVLEPLGLTRTFFGPAVPEENLAVPYSLRRVEGARVFGALDAAWAPGPYLPAGAGPRSTVRDLLRYLELFRQDGAPEGRRFLSEESMIYLTAGHALTPTPYAYGGGWFVQPDWHGVTLIDHGGGFTGSSAHLLFLPETGMTAVALVNRTMAPAENLALGAVWAAMHNAQNLAEMLLSCADSCN